MKNLFIAFEGIDGSGKSSHVRLLADHLNQLGHRVHCTAEPTRRPAGALIRDIFAGRQQADQHVIAALFAADRLDHLLNADDGMLNLLKTGSTVITDRYHLSSYAYHGAHVDMDWVMQLNRVAADLRRPDITIYLDVKPEVSMERIRLSRQSTELYETLSNLQAVYRHYEQAIAQLISREHIVRIDGSGDQQTVSRLIWEAVSELLD